MISTPQNRHSETAYDKSPDTYDICTKFTEQIKLMGSLVIICGGKVGIRGIFDLKLIN